MKHYLTGLVALWLKQQRIHVGMASYSSCLGLHSLCSSYLQSLRGGKRVECHVLRFEGCRMIAILAEDTTESRGQHAFPHVASCSSQHHRM